MRASQLIASDLRRKMTRVIDTKPLGTYAEYCNPYCDSVATTTITARRSMPSKILPPFVAFFVHCAAALVLVLPIPILLLFATCPSLAQESPYIVTYDHYLEEPGNLEVEYFSTFGTQRGGNDFHAFWMEFEYGTTAWWTTELYFDGQTTFSDSTLFTGFRVENRLRLLPREHFVNPVLYIQYEQTSAADKILKEVEGHDVESDFAAIRSLLPPFVQLRIVSLHPSR